MTKRDLGFDHEDICGKLEIIPGFHFYITAINSKHQSSFLFSFKVELIFFIGYIKWVEKFLMVFSHFCKYLNLLEGRVIATC